MMADSELRLNIIFKPKSTIITFCLLNRKTLHAVGNITTIMNWQVYIQFPSVMCS